MGQEKDLKAGTHQADFKELAVTKPSHQQRLDQKAALEHTAQTTTDCKLTRAVPTCISCLSAAINSKYSSFKRRNRNKDISSKPRYTKRKQSSAYHFEYQLN